MPLISAGRVSCAMADKISSKGTNWGRTALIYFRLAAAPVPVTLVAVDAVVNVAADSLVGRIGLRLRMAVGALEDRIVTRIGMAGGAHPVGISVIRRKIRMIPVGGNPCRGVMAGGTCSRESRRHVIGIGCSAVIDLVT